jgi:hypothetical protein
MTVSANITAPGPITLQAPATASGGGSLTVSSGATLQSGAPITLSAGGNSGAGGGATLTVAGTLNAPSATIYAGSATAPDQGNDTITITPSALTPITVVGGQGTDTLNIDALGLPVTISGNTITVGTLMPVTFTNIHAVNITSEAGSSLTLDGTSGAANTLSLVGTGQETGTATLNDLAFSFSGMASFSYQGGAGDSITVTPFSNANAPWNLAVTVAGGTGAPADLTYNAAGPYDNVTASANAAGVVAEPGVATVSFANVAQVTVNYQGIPNVVQVPNLTLKDAGGIYNGTAFPATTQVNGVASTAPTVTYYSGSIINAATQLSGAPINAGVYTVVATLPATATTASASAATTFIIAPAAPTVSVNPVTLTYGAALTNSQLKGTATLTVNNTQVTVPGTFSYASTNPAGTVLTVQGSPYTEAVTFTPSSTLYATQTAATVQVTVRAAATTTALTSSLNHSGLGQTVTFTAQVTAKYPGSGTPTGTVTFKSGTTTLAAAVPLSGGVAAFSTSGLALGSYSITAVYSSDTGNYSTSTSTAVRQVVVAKVSTTVVTTSLTPSPFGQKVTFKATVTGPGGTPAGKVTFKDGAAVVGTVLLSGGTASLSTALLTTGTHSITAVYSGNATFGSSTSTVLTQTINAAANAKLRRR